MLYFSEIHSNKVSACPRQLENHSWTYYSDYKGAALDFNFCHPDFIRSETLLYEAHARNSALIPSATRNRNSSRAGSKQKAHPIHQASPHLIWQSKRKPRQPVLVKKVEKHNCYTESLPSQHLLDQIQQWKHQKYV